VKILINRYIYIFLRSGISALDEQPFDSWGNGDILSEQLLNKEFKRVYCFLYLCGRVKEYLA